MSDFGGVFEVIANDDSQARLASRQALVLSETRIAQRLGKLLGNATTGADFDARFSYVEDDFKGIVQTACEEVGHGKPEAIVASLKAHLRNAADDEKDKLEEEDSHLPPQERQFVHPNYDDDEEDEKTSSVREARKPKMCPYHSEIVDISLGAGDAAAGYNTMQPHAWGSHHCQGDWDGGKCNFKREMVTQSYWDDRQKNLDDKRERATEPVDTIDLGPVNDSIETVEPIDSVGTEPIIDSEPVSEGGEVIDFPGGGDVATEPLAIAAKVAGDFNPSDQDDKSKKVPCPQCGGDGETNGGKECSKCHGKGRVADWGPSALDAIEGKTAENETGLGGPEPKIDKRLWTPQNVRKVEVPSEEHPTKQKDPIEPIKAINADPLKEIGENRTERVDLPSGTGLDDSGFASGGVSKGPNTDTWAGKDGQTEPVTAKADDVELNPVREMLINRPGFVAPETIQRVTASLAS